MNVMDGWWVPHWSCPFSSPLWFKLEKNTNFPQIGIFCGSPDDISVAGLLIVSCLLRLANFFFRPWFHVYVTSPFPHNAAYIWKAFLLIRSFLVSLSNYVVSTWLLYLLLSVSIVVGSTSCFPWSPKKTMGIRGLLSYCSEHIGQVSHIVDLVELVSHFSDGGWHNAVTSGSTVTGWSIQK